MGSEQPTRRGVLWGLGATVGGLALAGRADAAVEPLHINTHSALWPLGPGPRGPGAFFVLVEAALAALGRPVELGVLPAERSLRLLSAGIEDGDGPRIEQMDSFYPELRRVPEPLLDYRFVAFGRPGAAPLVDWRSLEGRDVAIVRGWKILERSVIGAASRVVVRTPELLFGLLARDRAELAIFEESMGLGTLEALGLSETFVPLPEPLAVRPMVLFLHRRHHALLQPLAAELRRPKTRREGRALLASVLGDHPLASFPGLDRHWGGAA